MGDYVNQVSGSTSNIGGLLSTGWSTLSGRADQAFTAAMSLAAGSISPASIDVDVPGAPNLGAGVSVTAVSAPQSPGISTLSLTFPAAPTFTAPTHTVGTAPAFSGVTPGISYPSAPSPSQPNDPGQAPIVGTPVLPADPTVQLPSVPSLRDLTLPEVPSVYISAFAGSSPADDLPELAQPNFIWEESPYTEKLPELAGKIANYLAFDFDAAETAIWERGQERVDRATNEATNAIANDFAARGFALPTGSMLAAINEARMKGAEARYDNARDAMIKAAELNTQKLTLAIQSGIQYEGMWMNYQTAYVQRAFDAAKTMVDVTLKLFDAKVALFNARLQAYQTEAQVHRDLIQAELAKIEVYKSQLEGQKIIGDLNMQDVELYKAQLTGAMTAVDLYKAQVSAVVATIEVDKARLQGYETSVQAYKARIEANTAMYAAWGEQMRGEAVKGQIYESEVRAFAARVDAYKSQESVGIESAKLQLANNDTMIKGYAAMLGGLDSQVKAYAAEADAQARIFASEGQVYGAKVGAEEAKAKIALLSDGLQVDVYKAAASVAIQQAQARIAGQDVWVRAFLGKQQNAGQIISQLAASAMSAFNLSASAGESFSLGVSNTLSESYSL